MYEYQYQNTDWAVKAALVERSFKALALWLTSNKEKRRYYAVTSGKPCSIVDSMDSSDPHEIELFLTRHDPKRIFVDSRMVELELH